MITFDEEATEPAAGKDGNSANNIRLKQAWEKGREMRMSSKEAYMALAMEEAQRALEAGDVPVGAVVVCGDEVVSSAGNEREQTGDPTAHAEILALRRAAKRLGRRRLDGCTLYVTLEPCPMCAGAISMAGVDAVYFGAYDRRCGCAGSLYALTEEPAFGGCVPAHGGLMEQACSQQLAAFFKDRRAE